MTERVRISKKAKNKLDGLRMKHNISFANALDAYLEEMGNKSVVRVRKKRGKKLEFTFKQKRKQP